MSRPRIWLIGADGQLGQEFVRQLGQEQVRSVGRAELDVGERDAVLGVLAAASGDAIVNLAAYHDVNGCEADPGRGLRVNGAGAQLVAAAARRVGMKVVFVSSDYVFGADSGRDRPYLEDDPPAPINAYGVSKLAGEQLVRLAHPDDHLIVRSSSLFGVTTSKKGWTFPELMLTKARRGEPLRVVADQVMAPTATADLASRILDLIAGDVRGTLHVTNAGSASWFELAQATLEFAGVEADLQPVSSAEFPTPARRPAYSVLASGRAIGGFGPLRTWRAALSDYLVAKGWRSVPGSADGDVEALRT